MAQKTILHKKDLCERKCLCRRIMVNLFCSKIAGAKLFVSTLLCGIVRHQSFTSMNWRNTRAFLAPFLDQINQKRSSNVLTKKSHLETVKRYGPNQKECSNWHSRRNAKGKPRNFVWIGVCVVTLELVPRIPCPQSTHVIEPPFLRDPDKKGTSLSKI